MSIPNHWMRNRTAGRYVMMWHYHVPVFETSFNRYEFFLEITIRAHIKVRKANH